MAAGLLSPGGNRIALLTTFSSSPRPATVKPLSTFTLRSITIIDLRTKKVLTRKAPPPMELLDVLGWMDNRTLLLRMMSRQSDPLDSDRIASLTWTPKGKAVVKPSPAGEAFLKKRWAAERENFTTVSRRLERLGIPAPPAREQAGADPWLSWMLGRSASVSPDGTEVVIPGAGGDSEYYLTLVRLKDGGRTRILKVGSSAYQVAFWNNRIVVMPEGDSARSIQLFSRGNLKQRIVAPGTIFLGSRSAPYVP